MADQRGGGIAWTDQTWNPTRGCSRVSAGCQHCYAELVAARFSGPGQPYEGLARRRSNGEPQWTGKVVLVEKHLADPLRWKEPRRIFVNSMSDLFHENLPWQAIARVFAVMALAPRHTFQVLTKRPARMLEAMTAPAFEIAVDSQAIEMRPAVVRDWRWPLPNVWLGVSAEDQAAADERIPLLLDTPAAVRFVSAEPLLGPIEFTSCGGVDTPHGGLIDALRGWTTHGPHRGEHARLAWVIVGGESGPGARPCDVQWVRLIKDQCAAAGVACFVKQLGANVDTKDGRLRLLDRKGGDWSEWREDLRVREFPTVAA